MKKFNIFVLFAFALLLVGIHPIYAQSNIDSDGRITKPNDGIFSWINREERIASDGSFSYSFYDGLASDKFKLHSPNTTIYTNSRYSGYDYLPGIHLNLYEKPYRAWTFNNVGSKMVSANGSDSAYFGGLHNSDAQYYFRLDTEFSSSLHSPVTGNGSISNFGGKL